MTEPYRLLPPAPLTSLKDVPLAGKALAKAKELGPEGVINMLKEANLRGRGGAGFPTHIKWNSLRNEACKTKFLVCNAAEGEPGTFKDRTLIRYNPYILLEGVAIGAYTTGATAAFIGMKKTFQREFDRLTAAKEEMMAAGLLGDIPIHLAFGPDEYLLGEERGLIQAIETGGGFPYPRVNPPYMHGMFTQGDLFSAETANNNPTIVNNAETFSHACNILRLGPDAFKSVGTKDTPGTGIFTVVGDVKRPGVYELPMGTPFRTLIEEHAGGMLEGRKFKMMLSGVSSGAFLPQKMDTPMDFSSMRAAGSGFGSGGYIIYDDTADALDLAAMYSKFLANESCGQCPSCKYETGNITTHLEKLSFGYGSTEDLYAIDQAIELVATNNRCFLPIAERVLIRSLYVNFVDEFVAAVKGPRPQSRREYGLPKLKDYDPATHTFTFDPKFPYKRPDATYNTEEQGPYRYFKKAGKVPAKV